MKNKFVRLSEVADKELEKIKKMTCISKTKIVDKALEVFKQSKEYAQIMLFVNGE